MAFAKIFESEKYGQLLVTKDEGSNGPRVAVHAQPHDLGVCVIGVNFPDDQGGWDKQDAHFDRMDLEIAETQIKPLFDMIAQASEPDE